MGVSVFGTHVRIPTPCVIIRTPFSVSVYIYIYIYITLEKLYIINESIRQITITLFIINFMKNIF